MKNTFKNIIVHILTWESKLVLKRYKPKIVAITGSVGKTSTKDAIYTVLSHFYVTRKSEKSFNSEIGLPLTILGIPNGWSNPTIWLENILKGLWLIVRKQSYPELLVLEIGAGKPGDITSVAKWLKPDMVVLTRFPETPVHVEFFGSTDKIIEEKMALAYGLKENGTLIINQDDNLIQEAVYHKVKRKVVSYGFDDHSTYKALYPQIAMKKVGKSEIPFGMNFKMYYNGSTFPVSMDHIVGINHIYAGMAALAVAIESGCDILAAIETIAEYRTPPGRLAIIEGINGSVLIDDTYNSSPAAMDAALDVLDSLGAKRKIAVLGDMLELGKMTQEAHIHVGQKASGIADIIVLVGPRSKFIADGALEAGFPEAELYIFDTALTAGAFLEPMVKAGDVLLVKGSQGVRMERIVQALMHNPEEAPKLLARQEKEWKER